MPSSYYNFIEEAMISELWTSGGGRETILGLDPVWPQSASSCREEATE